MPDHLQDAVAHLEGVLQGLRRHIDDLLHA